MDLDDLLRRYFGTTDMAAATPAVVEAGLDRLHVDFGFETDRGRVDRSCPPELVLPRWVYSCFSSTLY